MQEAIAGIPPTAKFYLTPVPAQGTTGAYPSGTTISGNTLNLTHYSDFTAYFNVQIEDWDPLGNGPFLKTWQAKVDATDYLGANATPSNSGVNLTKSTPTCSSNS